MSSGGYESIFDHAAGIVRLRCRELPGVDAVLASLRGRAARTGDPRVERDLFFEPWIDAQELGVPVDTAEEVARQLLELTALRLWTRVRCPEVPAEEDGTMFETDSEEEFRAKIGEACPHCGTTHDLIPSQIETVYSPNFPGSGGVAKFEYDKLKPKRSTRRKPGTERDSHIMRCEEIAETTAATEKPVAAVVALALSHNSPPEAVPAPVEAWTHLWLGPLLVLLIYMILIIPIAVFVGNGMALVVSIVVVLIVYLTLSTHVHAKLAPSALQRQAVRGGVYLSILLVGAGSTGIEFSLTDENRVTIPLGEGPGLRLPVKVEYGSVNLWLLGAGVLCFLSTLAFVVIYDRRLGWFDRDIPKGAS